MVGGGISGINGGDCYRGRWLHTWKPRPLLLTIMSFSRLSLLSFHVYASSLGVQADLGYFDFENGYGDWRCLWAFEDGLVLGVWIMDSWRFSFLLLATEDLRKKLKMDRRISAYALLDI